MNKEAVERAVFLGQQLVRALLGVQRAGVVTTKEATEIYSLAVEIGRWGLGQQGAVSELIDDPAVATMAPLVRFLTADVWVRIATISSIGADALVDAVEEEVIAMAESETHAPMSCDFDEPVAPGSELPVLRSALALHIATLAATVTARAASYRLLYARRRHWRDWEALDMRMLDYEAQLKHMNALP